MQMTTEMAEPSTGRITITCYQLFPFPYFVQHHYGFFFCIQRDIKEIKNGWRKIMQTLYKQA
jgi:hypothetical protein